MLGCRCRGCSCCKFFLVLIVFTAADAEFAFLSMRSASRIALLASMVCRLRIKSLPCRAGRRPVQRYHLLLACLVSSFHAGGARSSPTCRVWSATQRALGTQPRCECLHERFTLCCCQRVQASAVVPVSGRPEFHQATLRAGKPVPAGLR